VDKSKVRILVVDDEQGLCAGLQEALQREGYRVDASTDAVAAAKLASERLYNLVISDIKMPGIGGMELLARVRERSRDTLFILMTAYGTVENAVEAMKQGAYDYLAKPIDMKRLRVLVQKALEFQADGGEQRAAAASSGRLGAGPAHRGKREHARGGAADRGGGQQ
jgi:DNA-binding NtrC family response regulator